MERLVIERIFNHPVEKVWDAWTNPEAMKQWSFPRGFKHVSGTLNLVVGGKFSQIMQDPEGKHWKVVGEYTRIDPKTHLEYSHGWEDNHGNVDHYTNIEILLTSIESGTKMIFTQSNFLSEESLKGHDDGWNEAFDNLAKALE